MELDSALQAAWQAVDALWQAGREALMLALQEAINSTATRTEVC